MKIICIGRNYVDHIKELNNDLPKEPVFFFKPDTAILIRNRPFYIPDFSSNLHYETELVYKICKVGKHISKTFTHTYYDQVGLGIDFTARDVQKECMEKGLPWEKAKGFDNSAPVSTFINMKDIPDRNALGFHMELNGTTVQQGNSMNMIFKIDDIIAYVSQFVTLRTGDLIFTGTPAGVGPVKKGDTIKAWIGDKKMLDFKIL